MIDRLHSPYQLKKDQKVGKPLRSIHALSGQSIQGLCTADPVHHSKHLIRTEVDAKNCYFDSKKGCS
jgi:hypothetical protein